MDDDADIREIVEMSLSLDGGLKVLTSDGGERALLKMRIEQPDLVVLDVMMPGMDGPTLLRRMRSDPELARIPVIFMTAKARHQRSRTLARTVGDRRDRQTLRSDGAGQAGEGAVGGAMNDGEGGEAAVQTRLNELVRKFVARTAFDLAQMREGLARLDAGDRDDNGKALAQIHHLAHRICGTSGTLGLCALSDAAADLERRIEACPARCDPGRGGTRADRGRHRPDRRAGPVSLVTSHARDNDDPPLTFESANVYIHIHEYINFRRARRSHAPRVDRGIA